MKCYLHQTVDAIGICSECGQGVCDACAVKIAGRVYCKQDADHVFGRKRRSHSQSETVERGMANTVNAVMFVIYGAFGMVVGGVIVVGSLILGGASALISTGDLGLASIGFWGFGGVVLVLGCLSVVTGAWLWGAKMAGIGVGIGLLVTGLIFDMVIMTLGGNVLSYEVGMTFFAINAIMLILAAWGWRAINQFAGFEGEDSVLSQS